MDHPKPPCCLHNPAFNGGRSCSPGIQLGSVPFFHVTPPPFSARGSRFGPPHLPYALLLPPSPFCPGPRAVPCPSGRELPNVFTALPTPFTQIPLFPVTLLNPSRRRRGRGSHSFPGSLRPASSARPPNQLEPVLLLYQSRKNFRQTCL